MYTKKKKTLTVMHAPFFFKIKAQAHTFSYACAVIDQLTKSSNYLVQHKTVRCSLSPPRHHADVVQFGDES